MLSAKEIADIVGLYYVDLLEQQLQRKIDIEQLRTWVARYLHARGAAVLHDMMYSESSFKVELRRLVEVYLAETTIPQPAAGRASS